MEQQQQQEGLHGGGQHLREPQEEGGLGRRGREGLTSGDWEGDPRVPEQKNILTENQPNSKIDIYTKNTYILSLSYPIHINKPLYMLHSSINLLNIYSYSIFKVFLKF